MAADSKQRSEQKGKRPLLGRKVKLWIAAIIAVLVLIVIFQNTRPAEIRFLFWEWPMPQVVLMLLIFLCGALFGYIIRRKDKKRE